MDSDPTDFPKNVSPTQCTATPIRGRQSKYISADESGSPVHEKKKTRDNKSLAAASTE
jgi:hypothetical protein